MFLENCKAYLKTEHGELLETGYANISVSNKTVDFVNDFVPLLKLDSRVKIICVIKDPLQNRYLESHCFTGDVYLSSQKLLRIINVDDYIVNGAEKNLTVDTTLPARASILPESSSLSARFPIIRRWSEASVYLVAVESLRFTSHRQFEKGQKVCIQMKNGPLILDEVVVEIYETILFGSKLTGYRCNIVTISESDKANLYDFVRKANLIFSDEAIVPPPESIKELPDPIPEEATSDSQET